MTKTYPSHVLADALRERGLDCRLMWEIPGPKNTEVAWLSCYLVQSDICIVSTYKGGWWGAYTPSGKTEAGAIVEDVIVRTRRA